MENELKAGRGLRKEAESRKEEVEHGARSMTLKLEYSQKEKSDLVDQCHRLVSRLKLMAEEVKKSREIEERLPAELEKVKGVIQSGGHQIVGSSPQEVEHGALGLTLELDQCQSKALDWIGSRLELMAEEVKMSWEIEERFSAEKVKGATQTGGHQIVGSSPQEIENVAALLKHSPAPKLNS